MNNRKNKHSKVDFWKDKEVENTLVTLTNGKEDNN